MERAREMGKGKTPEGRRFYGERRRRDERGGGGED